MTPNRYVFLIVAALLFGPAAPGMCQGGPKKNILTPAEEKEIKGYTINLKQLLQRVKENIDRIKREFADREKEGRNVDRELMIRRYVEKGDELYRAGKFGEAQAEWEKALAISENPEMKEYIRKSVQRAVEEKKRLEKEDEERLKIRKEEELQRLDRIRAQVAPPPKETRPVKKEAPIALPQAPAPQGKPGKPFSLRETAPQETPAPVYEKAPRVSEADEIKKYEEAPPAEKKTEPVRQIEEQPAIAEETAKPAAEPQPEPILQEKPAPQEKYMPQQETAQEDISGFPVNKNILLIIIALLALVFWLILKIAGTRAVPPSKAAEGVVRQQTADSFEPRDLKKFLKRQYEDKDKDLFK